MEENKRHILIRITKLDQFFRFFKFVKEFSVNKFKNLYQKGKDLIKFFSDTKKLLILSKFSKEDKLSFSEIQQDLQLTSPQLAYDLKQMTSLGFLEKLYQKARRNKTFSYYQVTELGRAIIDKVFINQ